MSEKKIWRDVIVLVSKLLMTLWVIVMTILLLHHPFLLLFVVSQHLSWLGFVSQQTDPSLHSWEPKVLVVCLGSLWPSINLKHCTCVLGCICLQLIENPLKWLERKWHSFIQSFEKCWLAANCILGTHPVTEDLAVNKISCLHEKFWLEEVGRKKINQ